VATKTLYVQDRDLPIWEAAKRVAARRQVSESQLVKEALEDYLPRIADEPVPADRWAAIGAEAA
jgi:hypothetical protein